MEPILANGDALATCGKLARMRPSPGNLVVRANYLATVVFGLSLALFVIAVTLPDVALLPAWPDDIGGPVLFVFGLAYFSYLIALLCGELALVGDGVSDAARRAPAT